MAQDVELRETCYGAMDTTDTVVNIVVNIILILIRAPSKEFA